MNKTGIFLMVVVVGILLFFVIGSDDEITNADSTGTTIVAFGDSLVEGVGASEGNTFVDLLSKRIGRSIINEGESGNTTADGLARVDEVVAHNPKVVIVLLGGNDALRKISKETTFQNLREIVTRIHNSGSAVVLVGVQSGLFRDAYKKEFETLAEELGTAHVPDILDGLIGNNKLMADAIHPNDEGYVLVADRIEPVLRELLRP